MMRALALVLVAACGSSSSRPPPRVVPRDAPQLIGRPIWDGPLDDAGATRLLERVRTSLEIATPSTARLETWIAQRIALIEQIEADATAVAASTDPRMKLIATIAIAVANDDFITDAAALGAHTPAGVIATARKAFEHCRQLAPTAAEVLRPWAGYCGDRAVALADIDAGFAAPSPPRRDVLADCETTERPLPPPSALPPDKSVKPSLVYLYDDTEIIDTAQVARLEAAVAKKLAKTTGMKLVRAKDRNAARKLANQNQLHAKAPVCGQGPPVTAVLAYKAKHLVIGDIRTPCVLDGGAKPATCGLSVTYRRAGDTDGTGLPPAMWAPIDKTEDEIVDIDFIAAAGRLAPGAGGGGLLGSLRTGGVYTGFSGFDEDPWLNIPATLRGPTTERLAACVDAAASFDATFTITPEGATRGVSLAPVTAPPAASRVAACVQEALEKTPWPCTRDGKPAQVDVRLCVAPET